MLIFTVDISIKIFSVPHSMYNISEFVGVQYVQPKAVIFNQFWFCFLKNLLKICCIMVYLTKRYEQFISIVISIYVTSYLTDKNFMLQPGASKTGLPEGKQSKMSDSTVTRGQYSELYAPVAVLVLKLPFPVLEKCSSFSNCFSRYSNKWELLLWHSDRFIHHGLFWLLPRRDWISDPFLRLYYFSLGIFIVKE